MKSKTCVFITLFLIILNCFGQKNNKPVENKMNNLLEVTFGNGCFWCTEAIFLSVKGVEKVIPGYSGGKVNKPTYKDVCGGLTGHAEVIRVVYNPNIVSFEQLLEVFFQTHDPTTLNRQGNDTGTQYRSVIFYHNNEQKDLATEIVKKLNDEKAYPKPIVTEISPLINFFEAENYHQNYYNLNKGESYCRFVIQPKMEKFQKVFKHLSK